MTKPATVPVVPLYDNLVPAVEAAFEAWCEANPSGETTVGDALEMLNMFEAGFRSALALLAPIGHTSDYWLQEIRDGDGDGCVYREKADFNIVLYRLPEDVQNALTPP